MFIESGLIETLSSHNVEDICLAKIMQVSGFLKMVGIPSINVRKCVKCMMPIESRTVSMPQYASIATSVAN